MHFSHETFFVRHAIHCKWLRVWKYTRSHNFAQSWKQTALITENCMLCCRWYVTRFRTGIIWASWNSHHHSVQSQYAFSAVSKLKRSDVRETLSMTSMNKYWHIKVTAYSEWAFLLVMDGIKIDQIYLPRYDIDFYTIKRELIYSGFPR